MDTHQPGFFEKASQWLKQSVTIRLITIGILILFLLIPVSMIEGLIRERESRQEEAIQEVSAIWGQQQTLVGPILSVPYKTYSKVFENGSADKYKLVESVEYAHFLPDELRVSGAVSPEMRYRGIYEVIVYNARMNLDGRFSAPDFAEWNIEPGDILWNEATLSLGLSDVRSIQDTLSVRWGSRTLYFNPGVECDDLIKTGISARVPLGGPDSLSIPFSLALNMNGSSGLSFTPVGKTTWVDLSSTWQNPSFSGAFLPDKRDVRETGFTAGWKVLHLNRSYPQQFRGTMEGLTESAFGVDLIVPVDEYQKSMRAAKYAVMFITLTFLVFFFVQILNGVRIHPIQYFIVGLSLCVFYTLLIGLSEHIPFSFSYLISSVSVVGLITFYAYSIFRQQRLTWLVLLILTALYVFIFSVIQMEDYALLMGSIGLFLVLTAIVYLSRRIDWYALRSKEKE